MIVRFDYFGLVFRGIMKSDPCCNNFPHEIKIIIERVNTHPCVYTFCMLHVYFSGEYLFSIQNLPLQKVKDSWRVVNHRDIIPTIPRLMGYCHVAQPVYLATGDLRNALVGNSFCYLGKFSINSPTALIVNS